MVYVEEDEAGGDQSVFSMRLVVLGVLAPALLLGIAVGIALPLIPVSAVRLGGDLATAGFVAALLPIGKIISDLPAGALAERIGDRRAMVLAAVLAVIAFAGAAAAPTLWLLEISILLLGVAIGVFQLARHAYVAAVAPPETRGRVLSTLGGMHRLGYFFGPFLGALVIVGSSPERAYWLGMGFAVATLVVLLAVSPSEEDRAVTTAQAAPAPGLLRVVVRHRRLFLTLGSATVLVGAVRGARVTVLPLWGAFLDLDPETISLIFGLSGGLDMLLFYPAGKVMDRFGRLWIAVPSMLTMAAAMCLLPLTDSALGLSVVAGLLGLGNGLGSGILMTLGADVAPPDARSSFLGVWRLFQDTGEAAGPLVVAAGAALGSLAAGIYAAASFGLLSSAALARWVPEFSPFGTRMASGRSDRGGQE